MDGLVIRPCLPFLEEARTAGPLCSTGITPLLRSYEPLRLPLAFGRLPTRVNAEGASIKRIRGPSPQAEGEGSRLRPPLVSTESTGGVGFVDGLQLTRFPSWLPSKLRGFWFFPQWAYLPPSVLAFWSYKLTSPEPIEVSQVIAGVGRTTRPRWRDI
jgi:hypothetical protein